MWSGLSTEQWSHVIRTRIRTYSRASSKASCEDCSGITVAGEMFMLVKEGEYYCINHLLIGADDPCMDEVMISGAPAVTPRVTQALYSVCTFTIPLGIPTFSF